MIERIGLRDYIESKYNYFLALSLIALGSAIGMTYNRSLEKAVVQHKVLALADADRDGKLSVEEMVDVYTTLDVDSAKRFRETGFYFTRDEAQTYLKLKGKFNPETDE